MLTVPIDERIGHGGGTVSGAGRLSDAWWAKRAKRFLHPNQVEIVEVFQRRDQPLSLRDLSEVFSETKPRKLKHHVGRLRHLGALELVGGKPGMGFMDVQYRLVSDPSGEAKRTPIAIQFGKNLRACRERRRLSREELGSSVSLLESEIGSIERGEREPSVGEVIALASALSAPYGDLLAGVSWKADGVGP